MIYWVLTPVAGLMCKLILSEVNTSYYDHFGANLNQGPGTDTSPYGASTASANYSGPPEPRDP